MILNDREIRKRCLVPTGKIVSAQARRHLYAQIKDSVYSMETGQLLAINQEHPLEFIDLTPEQQRGYVGPRMIEPYEPGQVKSRKAEYRDTSHGLNTLVGWGEERIISYGTSSYGYDLRLGHKVKVFTNVNSRVVDPKNFDEMTFVDVELKKDGDAILIPPNSFILGYSLEYLRIPRDIVGVVVGKSTIARTGINCLCTPLEPGWEGHVTLEFANNTPLPAKLYAGEGCCQVMFHQGEPCETSYADRAGKYQGQGAEPIVPKV
jgi:dCTP deaminase